MPFQYQINTILLSLASAHCCRAAAPREAGTIRTFPLRIWIWDTESIGCGTRLQGSSICWHLELTPEPHTSPRRGNKWSCREENEAQAGAKSERKRLRRGSRILLRLHPASPAVPPCTRSRASGFRCPTAWKSLPQICFHSWLNPTLPKRTSSGCSFETSMPGAVRLVLMQEGDRQHELRL